MKKAAASGIIIGLFVLCVIMFLGTENTKRNIKSIKSDIGGGLERTVTVYDYNGGKSNHIQVNLMFLKAKMKFSLT